MHTTPCGTTRFSFFLRNSFFRLVGFAPASGAAAASFGSLATSVVLLYSCSNCFARITCAARLSSSLRPRPSADPSACVRWCEFAARAPADFGGAATRDSTEFRLVGGCSSASPCGDRLPRGPRIQLPDEAYLLPLRSGLSLSWSRPRRLSRPISWRELVRCRRWPSGQPKVSCSAANPRLRYVPYFFPLALALAMFWVHADHANHAAPMDDLALHANFLH